MRIILIILSLLFATVSFSQKNYKVGKALWTYVKPANYKVRIDNFSSIRKKGDSIVQKNNQLDKQQGGDVILFSVAKNDSLNLNIIQASYQSNSNIVNFTLSGYVDKLVEFFKSNYEKLEASVQITKKEIFIDKVKFYIVESKIYHKEKSFTYWSRMYIAELGGKEINITAVYDNENDRKTIEKSITTSKFATL
jgi:hypothetical protein